MDLIIVVNLLLGLSLIAAGYVLLIGNSASALHILFSGVRLYRGRASRFSWLVAGRSLTWLAAMIWSFLFLVLRSSETGTQAKSYNDTLLGLSILILITALTLQILLPIIEILRNRKTSSYFLTICCFLSYPSMYAMVLYVSVILGFFAGIGAATQSRPPVEGFDPWTRDMYVILERDADIREAYYLPKLIYNERGEVRYTSDSSRNVDNLVPHVIGLWLETSWNKIVFEQPNFSANFTAVDFNRKNVVVANLIWAYELTINFFFWAIIFVLARAIVRRIIQISE